MFIIGAVVMNTRTLAYGIILRPGTFDGWWIVKKDDGNTVQWLDDQMEIMG